MTENGNHRIDLETAAKLTKTFRLTPFSLIAATLTPIQSETFAKAEVQALLDQPGTVSIRIYYGLELLPVPKFRLIIVGVNIRGEDMEKEIILENGLLCPPACPPPSQLNS
jgi:hypothetical protein